MSKLQSKVYANALSMMGALVVVVVIFMVFSRPELINKLGSYSILFYRVSFSSEAKNVLGQLAHEIGKQLIQFNDHEVAVGVSYGEYTLCGTEDAGQALAEADKNMYEKKTRQRP